MTVHFQRPAARQHYDLGMTWTGWNAASYFLASPKALFCREIRERDGPSVRDTGVRDTGVRDTGVRDTGVAAVSSLSIVA